MEQVSYIHVDSRSRDTTLYPFSNAYTVFLNKPITNVTRVDLVSAIVTNPFSTNTSNAYLWLDITELRTPSTYTASKLTLTNVGPLASPTVGIVTIGTVNGTTISGQANQVYTNVASTATGNGTGARFTVTRSGTGAVSAVTVTTAGSGYSVGDTITISYTLVGGGSSTDNITFPVATVTTNQIQRNQPSSQTPATSFAAVPINVAVNFQQTFREMTDYSWSVAYPSRLDSIERLTIRWLDYQGSVVNFGNAQTYDPNMFILRVYTQVVPTTPERPLSLPPPVNEGFFNLEDKSKVYMTALGTLIAGLIMIMLLRKRR